MCSFIWVELIYLSMSWFSKVCDFEWGLFVFDFELFHTFKRLYTAKQLKWENTWAILESTALPLAKLLLIEQGLIPYRSSIHNHKLYSSAQW